jgi:hypothetical protein
LFCPAAALGEGQKQAGNGRKGKPMKLEEIKNKTKEATDYSDDARLVLEMLMSGSGRGTGLRFYLVASSCAAAIRIVTAVTWPTMSASPG